MTDNSSQRLRLDKPPVIVIPTPWTKPDGRSSEPIRAGDDYLTPIDAHGTLAYALNGLRKIEGDFRVVVVGTVSEPYLEEVFEKRLRKWLQEFADLKPIFIGPQVLNQMTKRLEDLGLHGMSHCVAARGCGPTRNLGLIGVQALGAETAVIMNDNHIVADPAFIMKASEFLGKNHDGEVVSAKFGQDILSGNGDGNRDGNGVKRDWWDYFWGKDGCLNEAVENVKGPPRLKRAELAQGIMVLTRAVFEQVAFDPHIPGGECSDYLFNAKIKGYQSFCDNELAVDTVPRPGRPHLAEMEQDFYRFLYTWRKLAAAKKEGDWIGVSQEQPAPFPADFVRPTLPFKCASLALLTAGRDFLQEDFLDHLALLRVAFWDGLQFARKHIPDSFELQNRWPEVMAGVREDHEMKEHLDSGSIA